MNQLVQSIIQPFTEAQMKSVALVPGGYKPPTSGHFYLVNEMAKRSEINEVIVLIGHKVRDGITAEQSLAIWEIYKNHLPSNVTIHVAEAKSPILDIHKIIGENPQNFYFPVVGVRSEADQNDIKRFDSLSKKYTNFKTIVLPGNPDVSGTKARQAIMEGNHDVLKHYLPDTLNDTERQQVVDILNPQTPVTETEQPTDSRQLLLGYIQSLNEYMVSEGMNVQPLPRVELIDNDTKNASDFFGKTAYYNPGTITITLYTLGRHPKDVMRSYAHEMVHHIQNLEDRLPQISTTNTNEDGKLEEIEREAYERGNITFRKWTDSITNKNVPN
jgi:phosphopantetheine adenylyltransferase